MIAPATLAGLALAHASHGRPVAPICPPDDHGNCRFPACGKIENNVLVPHAPKEVGKAPIGRLVPHGIGSATTSTPTITRWWEAQPDANVGIELWASDLLVVDPDSHETEVAAISNGLDGGVIRDSRNRAYVFKRPADCPKVNLIKKDGDPLDILSFNNFLVAGRHQAGVPISMDPDAEPGPAPAWAVELLRKKAAQDAARAAETASRRAERAAAYGSGTEPPVRLPEGALRRWRGEEVTAKADGGVDRSKSLFFIGLDLAEAGASESAIVAALAERDVTLGWNKYSGRRDDREYVKIAEKAVEDATAPRITFDGWFSPNGHANGTAGGEEGSSGTFGTGSGQREPAAWGEPDPLLDRQPAPDLPIDVFPREIADVALDAAERIRCPVDYTAWSSLVATAGLIGRGAGFRPRLYDDWTERLALWLVMIGPPSWMKSPGLDDGTRPLRRQQQRYAEEYRGALAAWKAECAAIKAENPKAKHHELPEQPVLRRCLTTDSTVEKLGELLMPKVSGGVTIHRDELAGLVHDLNKYRAGSDRQFYLQGYSGGVYLVDRIMRGETFIPDLMFSIVGGIQPEVAQSIFGSGPDDGLGARFTAVWPKGPGAWETVDRYPNRAALNALDAINDRLVASDWGTVLLVDEFKPTPYCRPDVAGYDHFAAWEATLMQALRSGEYEGRAEGRAGKYRGLAARIALVFHLINWAAGRAADPRTLPFTTVQAATDLMDRYVIPMERRVFGEYATPPAALGARRIARWIVRERREQFTVREIRRHHWSDLTEEADVLAALDWLVTAGWVREAAGDTSRIGRPPTVFWVNPKVIHRDV